MDDKDEYELDDEDMKGFWMITEMSYREAMISKVLPFELVEMSVQ